MTFCFYVSISYLFIYVNFICINICYLICYVCFLYYFFKSLNSKGICDVNHTVHFMYCAIILCFIYNGQMKTLLGNMCYKNDIMTTKMTLWLQKWHYDYKNAFRWLIRQRISYYFPTIHLFQSVGSQPILGNVIMNTLCTKKYCDTEITEICLVIKKHIQISRKVIIQ